MSDETNKWPDKIIVGLTGNIATGKSAIMKIAAEQGALTLDADKVVHSIMNNDRALQRAIIEAFGNEVAAEDGHINRSALAKIVFNNPEKLARLEGLIHPT
ncbi:MAG: dephospho-CoA kinase, partial [Anaerolineales bacterium]|nr:dephospho-CoA kinase [Anaerolineales bacterium]